MLISPIIPQIPVVAPLPTAVEPATRANTDNKSAQQGKQDKQSGDPADTKSSATPKSSLQLSEQERAEVQKLAQRDREVRAHEAAHKSAAGQYVRGGAQFDYQRGPDGRQYATGGEVSIDASRPDDPQAALQKALIIRRAALAPAQPSSQDRAVAAEATQMAAQAQADLLAEKSKTGENTATKAEDAESSSRQEPTPIEQVYSSNADENAPLLDVSV